MFVITCLCIFQECHRSAAANVTRQQQQHTGLPMTKISGTRRRKENKPSICSVTKTTESEMKRKFSVFRTGVEINTTETHMIVEMFWICGKTNVSLEKNSIMC